MAVDTTLVFAGPVDKVEIGGGDIGGTYDGVNITMEEEHFDLACDQVVGVVDKALVSRKYSIVFNIAEMSLAHLEKVLSQKSGNLVSSSLKLDTEKQATVTVEVEVPCPTGVGTRTYKFDICHRITGGEHSYKKAEQVFVPVTFEALPNPDNSDQFGYISDAE